MFRNIVYIIASILIFFIGMIFYGIILNIRETTLQEAMQKKGLTELYNVRIIVDRKNYHLDLYSNETKIKSYKAVFGRNNSNIKIFKGDYATPIGKYRICKKDTNFKYYKNLQLNYPTPKDAAEALQNRLITRKDYMEIKYSYDHIQCPPSNTPLGAEIGIHGIGKYNFIFKNLPFVFNWTDGSIAISNENIDELFSVTQIGTPVEIKN